MSRRVILTLLTASALIASGQSQAASYKTSQTSSTNYATIEQACIASGNAFNSSGTYTEIKLLSTTDKVVGVSYTCNLQGLNRANAWKDFKTTVYKDEKGCAPGESVAVKSAVASVSKVNGKYVVATRTPEEGCLAGCMVEQPFTNGSDRSTGCYFVTGSTTQGFCNYTLTTTGTSCASNTLSAAATGDPLTDPEPEEPEQPGDNGTGTPTNPGCVFDCDNGGSNAGSGSGGTGGTGSGGGTGTGTGGTGGTGNGSGNGNGNGSSGSGNGGSGGTGTGNGGTSGGSDNSGTPCKGLNFGESGCAEYGAAQSLNGTLQAASEIVKTAQDETWNALDKVESESRTAQQNSEDSLLQRFGSMLPAPGACVNPVLDFQWVVISPDVCQFSFVKKILAWMFAALTMIYVYRTMTSLGTNSEA